MVGEGAQLRLGVFERVVADRVVADDPGVHVDTSGLDDDALGSLRSIELANFRPNRARGSGAISHLVQVLPREESVLRKPPPSVFVLDDQIQSLVKFAVQTERVVLVVRLRGSRHWSLDFQLQIFPHALSNLRVTRDLLLVRLLISHGLSAQDLLALSIPNERFTLSFHRGSLVAYEDFIVPRLVAVTAVNANVPRGSLAVLRFAFPFHVGGCALLVVEVSAERKRETLIQALLVEEVGLLEAGEVASDERWAGDNRRGEDAVCFARGLRSDGRDVLSGG